MQEELKAAIKIAAKKLFNTDIKPELSRPDEKYGDYATNAALQLAQKSAKAPNEIADKLISALEGTAGIAQITKAGPGFINFKITDEALAKAAHTATNLPQPLAGQTIVAEYSDPNPFKPLHAGHLYTTLVGDAIAQLLEVGGAKVIRINYGGDVGLHVGRAMWGIIQELGGEHPESLASIPENERAAWLGQRYVEGTSAYESNEVAKAAIIETNKRVYQLHNNKDHDSPFAQIYWTCRGWSYQFFEQLYDDLQVHQFDRVIPESEVTPLGLQIVREHIGPVYQESDGAVVFKGEDYDLHTRVFINSQGLPTYEAKDVGLMLTKWRDYQYDLSLYITGNDQAEYMAVMFKSVEQFEPEAARRARSITNGMVKLAGGVKMSSRKGNILTADDVLMTTKLAISNSFKEVDTKARDRTMLAAVKYAFLKQRIGGDIIYDPKESVAIEGSSGPYLQYAHARARSILAKASLNSSDNPANFEPAERSLARKISEYPEVVAKATAELMPHHIAVYIYELAQAFNRFYEDNRVVHDPREGIRLSLVSSYSQVLKNGLELLHIDAPERM